MVKKSLCWVSWLHFLSIQAVGKGIEKVSVEVDQNDTIKSYVMFGTQKWLTHS